MPSSSPFHDELLALRADAARLLGTSGDEMLKASREQADKFADQLKAALNELSETLGQQERQLEQLIADRPIATLAGAFALGIVVGLAVRRI